MIYRNVLVLIIMLSSVMQAVGEFYGQTIVIDTDADQRMTWAANELKHWLSEATGKQFKVTTRYTAESIVLSRKYPNITNTEIEALKREGTQSFYISSSPGSLMILGNSSEAVSHGVFHYLQRLGFEFYLPDKKWWVIPKLKDIGVIVDLVIVPMFGSYNFFGTGGYGKNRVVDPDGKVERSWEDWKKRNGWGRQIKLGGHYGETFNQQYKEKLESNDYLALVDGARQYSKTAKYCYSNQGLIDLLVQDALKRLKTSNETIPVIAMDPADGGKHCTCAACQKMGTVSDRVFHAANEVAKAIGRKNPNAIVGIYAYNQHAAVPSIELEANIHVGLAPYAFQDEGVQESLIIEWAAKTPNLHIRDYWNIPAWNKDRPGIDLNKILVDKIDFWSAAGSLGFNVESSYHNAMGLALYIVSEYIWWARPPGSHDETIVKFTNDMFGDCREPMLRLFRRWMSGKYGNLELAWSVKDIREADKLAKDPATINRLYDLKAYMVYLEKLRKFELTEQGSKQRSETAIELIHWIWNVHPMTMIHSNYIHRLITFTWTKKNRDVLDAWNIRKKKYKEENWIDLVTKKVRVLDEFNKIEIPVGLETIPSDYARDYIFGMKGLNKEGHPAPTLAYGERNEFMLASVRSTDFVIRYKLKNASNPASEFYLTMFQNGVLEEDLKLVPTEDWQEISIPKGSPPYPYKVKLFIPKGRVLIDWGTNAAVFFMGRPKSQPNPDKLYFTIPANISKIAAEMDGKLDTNKLLIRDEKGRKVNFKVVDDLIIFETPQSNESRVYTYSSPQGGLRLLNIPNIFFHNPTWTSGFELIED